MEKIRILIVNLQKIQFKNDKTGEVSELCKITYCIKLSDSDNFKGYSILECYCNVNAFNKVEKFILKEVTADIKINALKNGIKYTITKINNEELK